MAEARSPAMLAHVVVIFVTLFWPAARSWALEQESAVQLCREYLASESGEDRQAIALRLAEYDGEIEPLLRALSVEAHKPVKPGYYAEKRFSSAAMREKYPRDLLYYLVPDGYRADRPTGLIVFMHGGGISTSRDAAEYTLAPDGDEDNDGCADMLAATGMITVGPSAPGKGESYYRWCLRSSEEYLLDVILECKKHFNIDPDRVFLLGNSMGGFGAFHHALRQPDRFAAIIVSSGSWDFGYWPAIRGTPLCIVQGVNDARRGYRWHYTDVEYGRLTQKIFEREKLDHVYFEHDGGHGMYENREKMAEYFASAEKVRRDPYFPHVTLASPQGFARNYLHHVAHNRWLTLDESTGGNLTYDELVTNGEDDFDNWRLRHRRTKHRGAMIDATNRGKNTIEVKTRNVSRFTVWLHPQMVDVSKRVKIAVNGKTLFDEKLTPSLATALDSYERRRDWGMIYSMKVELEVE
jgi:pimeloyl-ACP methyl ester carboxylesterase